MHRAVGPRRISRIRVGASILFAAFSMVGAGAAGQTARPRVQQPRWPCRLVVKPTLLGAVEDGWMRSATLRRQCDELAAARAVVSLEWGSTDSQSHAVTKISVHDGVVVARARIPPVRDAVVLVAHELHHVLERIRGVDFEVEADRPGSGVWRAFGGYETQAAIDAGRQVARELQDTPRRARRSKTILSVAPPEIRRDLARTRYASHRLGRRAARQAMCVRGKERGMRSPKAVGGAVSVLAASLFLTFSAARPAAAPARVPAAPTCNLPTSDADALVILSNYYPGYWWDHTDLTIAVQPHPKATEKQVNAIRDAFKTWSDVLDECFDGLITLTDVTGTPPNPQLAADIVVHFVPTAGGVVFGGYAICGDHGCPNILVRSDLPLPLDRDPYTPEYLGWVALHEIGHALGLGHATNLEESTDLMGYGWPSLGDPVLSQCDVEALAFVFAWAIEGSDPHPPGAGPYDCDPN